MCVWCVCVYVYIVWMWFVPSSKSTFAAAPVNLDPASASAPPPAAAYPLYSLPLRECERDRECDRECDRGTTAAGERGTGERDRERDERRDGLRRSLRPPLRCAGGGERERERPPPPLRAEPPLRAGGGESRERERRLPRGEREREWLRERDRRSLRLRLRERELCLRLGRMATKCVKRKEWLVWVAFYGRITRVDCDCFCMCVCVCFGSNGLCEFIRRPMFMFVCVIAPPTTLAPRKNILYVFDVGLGSLVKQCKCFKNSQYVAGPNVSSI